MGTFDYNDRLPSHYCGECSHVVFDDDDECPNCGSARPNDGWASIQDGFDPWLGRVLDGRYVVAQRVGQGSMGAVYRTRSLAISREFAVKIINFKEGAAGVDGDQIRARLHREIEAIGRLRNPHVVPFYEVLELFDHFVGVIMDFIGGTTLEALVLNEGPLDSTRAAKLMRQICNGVHEAHEAGMIHRDLKPDNVMVERMPAGDDFAHVLDFGIVRMDDGVSMTKGFLGTPLYASPEQAMAGEVDRRSDIYSLGAVFFFMLTGTPPFTSDNVYDILQSHVRKQAPTLSEARPERRFSEPLEQLVKQMLEKSPEKRPSTLHQVIHRVDTLLRSGALEEPSDAEDDLAPDSLEMVFETGRSTLARPGNGTEPTGLGESSSSVFESSERDRTGPKAAIFAKGRSRTGIQRIISKQKSDKRTDFDRVFQGTTGARTLGIEVPFVATLGAVSTEGDLLLADNDGTLALVRGGEVSSLERLPNLTGLGLSKKTSLAVSERGTIWELTPGGPNELFEDVQRKAMTSIAATPDDRTWIAGSASGRLYFCSPQAGKRVWMRIQDGPPISATAITERGDAFAVARRHGEIEISSVGNRSAPYFRFPVDGGEVRAIAFSGDGHLIAVLFTDNTVAVHLVEGGHQVHSLHDARNDIVAVGFRGHDLLGYFQLDGKMYARQLDRELAPNETK